MVTLTFDTLKASKDLRAAGFDELQAEALVATVGEALVGNVATKSDIGELRNDSELMRAELKGEIAELRNDSELMRAELKGEIAELRNDSELMRAELKGEIAELRNDSELMRAEFKSEIAELRGELHEFRAEYKGEIAELRGEVAGLRGEIVGLRNYTDVAISEVREDMRALELRMTIRLGGIVVASVGLGVAAMQLLG